MSSGRLRWRLGKTQREIRRVLWMLTVSELYVHTSNIERCAGGVGVLREQPVAIGRGAAAGTMEYPALALATMRIRTLCLSRETCFANRRARSSAASDFSYIFTSVRMLGPRGARARYASVPSRR